MTQKTYGDISDQPADPGVRVGILSGDIVATYSGGGDIKQVSTLQVTTTTNSVAYNYVIGGTTVEITSGGSATSTSIALALANAHNAAAGPASIGLAVAAGDTVTITARTANLAFVITTADSKLTLLTPTASAASADLPFGRGVQRDDFESVTAPGPITKMVTTVTPTAAVNDLGYHIEIQLDGFVYLARYVADASATTAEIVTGLTLAVNTMMPPYRVIATDSTTHVTLTAEWGAREFFTTGGDDAGGSMVVAITTEFSTKRIAGVAIKTQLAETDAGLAAYKAAGSVDVLAFGEIYVQLDDNVVGPVATDKVFCRLEGSGIIGGFRVNADLGESAELPNCYWTGPAELSLDGTINVARLMFRA